MTKEPDKPFVLGQNSYYRLVSVPTKEPGVRAIKYEARTTNYLGEQVFVPCDHFDQDYYTLVSAVMHYLYAEANRK